MELSGTYTIVLYSPYPAQVWVIGSSIAQNQQHKSPWLQIIVHLGHGTCTTEAINGLTVEVKAVAWRDPEDGLEIEDVELLQHPLDTGGSTKLTTGHGSITVSHLVEQHHLISISSVRLYCMMLHTAAIEEQLSVITARISLLHSMHNLYFQSQWWPKLTELVARWTRKLWDLTRLICTTS